jgi:two-component system, chemotaxis family, protein-glutamate methylesterase/glutaminase
MELQTRPTDLFLGIKCPHCGHRLSLLVGRSALTFHCLSGHTFPLRQLLQSQAQEIDRGLRAVLEVWEQKSLVLQKVVQQARSDDRSELAETFQREVEQTEGRIAALKDHLRNAGDSAVG